MAMAKLVLPRVHAMILCDDAEQSDQEAGVFQLTGVRTVIEASFPAVVSRFCVFLHMSGHPGVASCHVQIDHAEVGQVIYETETQTVAFDDPTFIVPMVFHMPDCVFPAPGLYYVQVYHESKLIGERVLQLRQED
jgi:hypothetical protein